MYTLYNIYRYAGVATINDAMYDIQLLMKIKCVDSCIILPS